MSNDTRINASIIRTGSLFALLIVWVIAAWLTNDSEILPMPWALVKPFWNELVSGVLPYHLGATLLRVVWAFVLAMSIGTILGLLMGVYPSVDRWLDPWLVVFLNLPALVLIVLCYMWIGLNETAAIAAVTFNKIPNVTLVIREGARALRKDLKDLSLVYKLPKMTYLRHILLPQLAPFVAAAGRSGLSVIWKIVLVVEFLGRSSGVGFQIHLNFQLFDVTMVLVYSFSFIAIMLAVEWLLLQPFERRVNRWRHA